MKKIALITALTLVSLGQACPVVPGYAANGLFTLPSEISPECGILSKIMQKSLVGEDIKWAELYQVDLDHAELAKVSLEKGLFEHGFTRLETTENSLSKGYGYLNRDNSEVIILDMVKLDKIVYIKIFGN